MRTIRLRLHVPDKPASDVYATLANFERYPQLCDAVQKVTITERSGNLTVSQWEVTFRAGLLCWTEEDTFDPGALTITFRQLEGDVAVFDGSWRCVDAAQGSEVLFSADLDLGIPSLADALEPSAAHPTRRSRWGARHEPAAHRAGHPGQLHPGAGQVPQRDSAAGAGETRQRCAADLPRAGRAGTPGARRV